MKNRILIIALAIAVLAAFSSVPRANAEPLTIMAIVGVATVLSISTVDIVASQYEDNRDLSVRRMKILKKCTLRPKQPNKHPVLARLKLLLAKTERSSLGVPQYRKFF